MLPQTAQLVTSPHFCEEKKCYSTNYLISVVTTVLPPPQGQCLVLAPFSRVVPGFGAARSDVSGGWCCLLFTQLMQSTSPAYRVTCCLPPLFTLLHLTVNNINIQNSIRKAFWTQPGPLIKSTEEPEKGCTALRGASFFSEPLRTSDRAFISSKNG